MKRILFVLAIVAVTMGNLGAGNVSQQMAQRIGERFLSTSALGQKRAAIELQLVSAAATRGGWTITFLITEVATAL